MIPEERLQAYRNHANRSELDQSARWAMGELLEIVVELDRRVDALQRRIDGESGNVRTADGLNT